MSDLDVTTQTGGDGGAVVETAKSTEVAADGKVAVAPTEASEASAETDGDEAQQKEESPKPKKRNGTREYIERLQTRWNDPEALERQLEKLRSEAPRLQDHNFNAEEFVEDAFRHNREVMRVEAELEAAQRDYHRVNDTFVSSALQFEQQHPDYREVVGSIPPQFLSPDLQFAIMGHERGPEIAYHIAQNEDDLFQLASIRPDLLGAAVDRLASRIAAPQRNAQPPAQQKPITQAPPPVATVSGRSPTETPPEKLTDAEWYAREKDQERAAGRGR